MVKQQGSPDSTPNPYSETRAPILGERDFSNFNNYANSIAGGWIIPGNLEERISLRDDLNNETMSELDGMLARVRNNSVVYGNITYVYESWRIVVPVILAILLLCTFVFSYLIIVNYRKDSEMNKCSKILLVSIAVFDVITLACSLVDNVYLYDKKADNFDTLPFVSCKTMLILERLSSIPNTISLWLTLMLSLQRYICVCKPFRAKDTITLKKTSVSLVVVIIIAIAFHIPRFLDVDFRHVAITKEAYPGQVIMTCEAIYKGWIRNARVYESTYLWTRFVFTRFIPLLLVSIFAFLMGRILSRKLDGPEKNAKVHSKSSSNKLSVYIVIVSVIIVTAEFPIGVLTCIYAVSISINKTIIPYNEMKRVTLIADVILNLSYCVIYLIYCLMTRNVRVYVSKWLSKVAKRSTKSHSDVQKGVRHGVDIEMPSSTSDKSPETSSSSTPSNDQSIISPEVA